jgi:hypothetical protein
MSLMKIAEKERKLLKLGKGDDWGMAIEELFIGRIEIPQHVRRYIEAELRMYKAYLSSIYLIDEELGEIYTAQVKPEIPSQGEISNRPLNIALKIESLETERKDKLSRVHKIEEGLKLFPVGSTNRRIIEVKYFSGMDWSPEQIMNQVNIGRRNSYFDHLSFIQRTFGVIFKIM